MKTITRNVAVRVAVATMLSVGLSVGAVGIASASPNGSHEDHGSSWTAENAVEGVVTGYLAGTSIAIEAHGSTTSTTDTLTSATIIVDLASGASLLGSNVVLTLSTSAPVTVTSILVEEPRSPCVEGVVTGYLAGTSIAIEAHGSTTSTTYTLTSATIIADLASGTSLLGSNVVLTLSTSVPVTVTSIKVATGGSKCASGHDHSSSSGNGSFRWGTSNHNHGRADNAEYRSARR